MTRLLALIRSAFYLLVALVGALVIIYSLALVLLGMEDVGGPKVAIPVAIGLSGLGVAIGLFGLRRLRDGAA